jgi:hypothetical protein
MPRAWSICAAGGCPRTSVACDEAVSDTRITWPIDLHKPAARRCRRHHPKRVREEPALHPRFRAADRPGHGASRRDRHGATKPNQDREATTHFPDRAVDRAQGLAPARRRVLDRGFLGGCGRRARRARPDRRPEDIPQHVARVVMGRQHRHDGRLRRHRRDPNRRQVTTVWNLEAAANSREPAHRPGSRPPAARVAPALPPRRR